MLSEKHILLGIVMLVFAVPLFNLGGVDQFSMTGSSVKDINEDLENCICGKKPLQTSTKSFSEWQECVNFCQNSLEMQAIDPVTAKKRCSCIR